MVLNWVFVYIWLEIPMVKSFPKWHGNMHTKIHQTCMKNLYALYIYQDSGATVQLVKALLLAPITLFWDKNSQFLKEPKVSLQIFKIFGWKVWQFTLKSVKLHTVFLHLDSILAKTFGGFGPKHPMGKLTVLSHIPLLIQLLTKFLRITSKKIIKTWISTLDNKNAFLLVSFVL